MAQANVLQHSSGILNDSYRGYSGLPPLAGLHSMLEAATTGLSVAESVARLKRIHWSLKRLHSIFVSHITSTAIYELKMAFSLHGFYCSEHVDEFDRPPAERFQGVSPSRTFSNASAARVIVIGTRFGQPGRFS